MTTGNEITEFGKLLNQRTKKLIDVQTYWVKVKDINWNEKTMTAIGVVDDLEFYEVSLGIGSIHRKPTIDSRCLIGIINNNANDTFLIECAECEEIEISDKTAFKWLLKNGELTMNGNQFGGLVKATELKTELDKVNLILQAMQTAFQSWVPVPNDGGAALKALLTPVFTMLRPDYQTIQNNKIKHG